VENKRIAHNKLPFGVAAQRNVYNDYRKSARRKSLSFELTFEKFVILASQNCSYCGEPPKTKRYTSSRNSGYCVLNGLDRMNNHKGYTLDNVTPCCSQCNYFKLTMNVSEFKQLIHKITNHQPDYKRMMYNACLLDINLWPMFEDLYFNY